MTAVGRCSETNFPFGVMFQLFESELRRPEDLETFAPRLHDAIGSEASLSVIPRIYRVCAEFAETSPLALSIDDADLADEQSLRFLLYLIERLSDLPIAIFLTGGHGRAETRAGRTGGDCPPSIHDALAARTAQPTGNREARNEDDVLGLGAGGCKGDPPRERRDPVYRRLARQDFGPGRGERWGGAIRHRGPWPRVTRGRRVGPGPRGQPPSGCTSVAEGGCRARSGLRTSPCMCPRRPGPRGFGRDGRRSDRGRDPCPRRAPELRTAPP